MTAQEAEDALKVQLAPYRDHQADGIGMTLMEITGHVCKRQERDSVQSLRHQLQQ